MDFKEWFRKHEREVFKRNQGCFDKAYIFGAKQGFKAGQQSNQAQINKALELLRQPMRGTVSDLLSELEDILNDT